MTFRGSPVVERIEVRSNDAVPNDKAARGRSSGRWPWRCDEDGVLGFSSRREVRGDDAVTIDEAAVAGDSRSTSMALR